MYVYILCVHYMTVFKSDIISSTSLWHFRSNKQYKYNTIRERISFLHGFLAFFLSFFPLPSCRAHLSHTNTQTRKPSQKHLGDILRIFLSADYATPWRNFRSVEILGARNCQGSSSRY